MARTRFASFVAALLFSAVAASAAADPVTLTTADGVKVFGEVWRAAGARPAVIVAFHQAESSSAEYAPIAPRLVQAGFTVLAIDQRSGNGNFGGSNRTVATLGTSKDYDDALPDLEAALAWAKGGARGAPIVVWGSSYSASLVFLLAAAHPGDVAGVVAYSPDEYLARKSAVRDAARKVTVPVFIDQASLPEEVAAGKRILAAVKSADKQQFVGKVAAPHGSSTLRADTNAAGAEAHWQAVLRFLSRFAAR